MKKGIKRKYQAEVFFRALELYQTMKFPIALKKAHKEYLNELKKIYE